MKLKVLLALFLLTSLGVRTAFPAPAPNQLDITIVVTTGNVTMENVGGNDLQFVVMPGTSTLSQTDIGAGRAIFRNAGDTDADWSVTATNFTNPSLDRTPNLNTAPGASPVTGSRLSGIWTQYNRPYPIPHDPGQPDTMAFDVSDVIGIQGMGPYPDGPLSTDSVFGDDHENTPSVKGYKVPALDPAHPELSERSMYFLFDAPVTITPPVTDQCTVTVTASISIH